MNRKKLLTILSVILFLAFITFVTATQGLLGCSHDSLDLVSTDLPGTASTTTTTDGSSTTTSTTLLGASTTSSSTTTTTPASVSASRITPSDFTYLGAFRLPYVEDTEVRGGEPYTIGWHWGGTGATYYPGNNSLYAIGHDHTMYVSEVSIPAPVNSRNLADLNTATTLRSFTNVRAGVGQLTTLFDNAEIRRAGLAYLSGKLYLCWGDHFQEGAQNLPSHMWCDLDFSSRAGAWRVSGDPMLYQTNDYMFEIPASWADAYVAGRRLATGRYRGGPWGGQGPALFAIAPWQAGNPPADGTTIAGTRLLAYSSTHPDGYNFGGGHTMTNYHDADEWSGGSWLTAGGKAAVIFIGTKGLGSCWYGFSDGTTVPIDGSAWGGTPPAYPHSEKGYWSSSYEAQVIFYDVADLAAVANGTMQPYEPQPYATLNLDPYLYNIDKINHPAFPDNQNNRRLGDCAYDRTNRLLYIFEYRGEPAGAGFHDDNPLVHVFRINP